ncbi:MAG TPA: metallophosphoesterase [Burkholderiales bacterium]|nr:metallophosphoesterase [Burkholderiales bacterium]
MPFSIFRKLPIIILLLHLYVGWRLLPQLAPAPFAFAATASWLAASFIATPLWPIARQVSRQPLRDRLMWASMLAIGSFSSLFVLTLFRDVALLATAVIGAVSVEATVRHQGALAVPALAALAAIVAFVNARRRAGIRRVDIPIAGLPAALNGFSIAQISDLHVGPTIKRDYLDRVVDAVNGLGADMIAVTGDLVDGSVRDLARHTEPLAKLTARHGAFFVTGNHEYYSGVDAWVMELRRLGLAVLMNEHVVLSHEGASVVVAGVTDYSAGYFDPAQHSDPARAITGAPIDAGFRLLLAHQPRSAFAAAPAGFDLQLSGHTHGGQLFPWNFVVRLFHPFTAGLHRVGGLWIYVSRGTGYWGPPQRLGAPSEITYLRLVPA